MAKKNKPDPVEISGTTTEPDYINALEFSRRIGVSVATVMKGLDSGRIHGVKEGPRYKIDWVTQSLAWDKNRTKPSRAEPSTWKPPGKSDAPDESDTQSEQPQQGLGGLKALSMKLQIERQKIIIAREKGILVPKSEVNEKLHKLGTEIRQSFQAIPTQVVDDVMASKTRNEAHDIIARAIDRALTDLSNLEL